LTVAATVLLRRPDGSILMQLRDDGRGTAIPFPNTWNFPGGLVEQGETPLSAAVREIEEEFLLNIDPSALREIWRYSHPHAASDHIFLCEVPPNTAPVLREGAALGWMTIEQIAAVPLGFEQEKILSHIPPHRQSSA
jgi:8-oxo-dGTP diphosphatase